jgi:peptidoglycan/LPS O-acetylase OafA/YrhL
VAALDGLRGLAAVVVVIRHAVNKIPMPSELRLALVQGPLAPLLNAQGAVQLFFVLSGWVLASSLARSGERPPWLQFYARRVFRIHPPYLFGVLVAWVASFGLPADPPTWIAPGPPRPAWERPLARELLGSLAFPGDAHGLLPVGWTLELEMIFSFLLPLLVVAARPARGAVLLAAAGAALASAGESRVLLYAIDFALGVVVYRERAAIARALGAGASEGAADGRGALAAGFRTVRDAAGPPR